MKASPSLPLLLLLAGACRPLEVRYPDGADKTDADVQATVQNYMKAGGLPKYATAGVVIERNVALGTNTASKITVNYPFTFMVLDGVAKLVTKGSTAGKPLTMQSVALMRNES